jgi:AcrR family transcriptional regulator
MKLTAVNIFFDYGQFLWDISAMAKPVQKRTLETRARLIQSAEALIEKAGYEALRVEEVVLAAGVAKGTFFAHFKDKDALMDLLIGREINGCLDAIEKRPPPESVDDLVRALMPLMTAMTSERYVFDVVIRHSGAVAIEEIGVIATTFERQIHVFANWLAKGPFRRDVPPPLLAEGVQAFAIQTMALNFCALHTQEDMAERLRGYLEAWLLPTASAR